MSHAGDCRATVSWSDRLRYLAQRCLPQRALTRLTYRLTRSRRPWLKDRLIRWFIARFQVDMSEAVQADPGGYADFNQFFTRALRAGARPLATGAATLCCPVDGALSQLGALQEGSLLQAKERRFAAIQLLGGDPARALPFHHGCFATLYLAPHNYHRIHMPLQGRLCEMVHIPGDLFSVSPLTARLVPDLFARNERVVTLFATAAGPMALVLVGAINVASIETVWAGAITPPLAKTVRQWRYPDAGPEAIVLDKGAELGRFNMGSTVILLFGQDSVRWDAGLAPGERVRLGQRLGEITASL